MKSDQICDYCIHQKEPGVMCSCVECNDNFDFEECFHGKLVMEQMYEDELPVMTDVEYNKWFKKSYVDGVRIGPLVCMK